MLQYFNFKCSDISHRYM